MTHQKTRTIATLALLKTTYDAGSDYIDNFVPPTIAAAKTLQNDTISLHELSTAIKSEFGITIPESALKTILTRVVKRGYLKLNPDKTISKNHEKLTSYEFASEKSQTIREMTHLITSYIDFLKRNNITASEDEAESQILEFIETNSSVIIGNAINGKNKPISKDNYHAALFVEEILEGNPVLFEYMLTIAKGCILANSIYYPDISGINRHFKNLTICLDTDFLMRALGLDGSELESGATEIIGILKKSNVKLRCFDITADELRGIISAHKNALRNNHRYTGSGTTRAHLLDSKTSPSDLELLSQQLEKRLATLGIKILTKPKFTENMTISQTDVECALKDKINYKNPKALHHDSDCLVSIHVLRDGRYINFIEDTKFLFISTNTKLHQASISLNKKNRENTVPLCVSDQTIGNLAWIKAPLEAPDIPRKALIANAYTASNPSKELWSRYTEEVEKLKLLKEITDEDAILYRVSQEAKTSLMEVTKGDPENIIEGTIHQVIKRAKEKISQHVINEKAHEQILRAQAESELTNTIDKYDRAINKAANFISSTVGGLICISIFIIFSIGIIKTIPNVSSIREISLPIDLNYIFFSFYLIFSIYEVAQGKLIKKIFFSIKQRTFKFFHKNISAFFNND